MKTIATSTLAALALTSSVWADPKPEHESQRSQASQLYQAGDYNKVVEITSAILSANQTDDIAVYLRGSAKVELGIANRQAALVREGIADASAAIQANQGRKNPTFNYYLPYLYGMTNLSSLEKNPSHAKVSIDIATKLLAQQSIDAESRANFFYQRALARNTSGDGNGSIDDYKQAVVANPKHLGALMALADAQAAAGQQAAALTTFNQATQAFPNEPLVFNNQGMFLQNIGRYPEAIAAFSNALQKNPNYFVAQTNRGFAYLNNGQAAEADRDFTASLQMQPNQLHVYSLRGTSKLVRGNWKEALADYETVTRSNPNDYVAWSDIGFAKFFGKDYAGALEAFDHVIKLQPTARFINPWRVWTLLRLNRGPDSAVIAEDSRKKPETERDWIDHVVLFHVGDMSSTQLENIALKSDKSVQAAQLCEARFFIAEQLLLANRSQEAAQRYQQALDTQARQLSAYRGSLYALQRFQ